MSDLLSSTRRVAAKDHSCFLCREPIREGYEYVDDRFAADGSAYTVKSHVACIEFMRDVDADEEWWTEGAIVECDGDYPEQEAIRAGRLAAARPGRSTEAKS